MIKNVIGLMSGTSMDGVDAAYLKTNGIDIIETGMAITLPYGESFRNELSENFRHRVKLLPYLFQ